MSPLSMSSGYVATLFSRFLPDFLKRPQKMKTTVKEKKVRGGFDPSLLPWVSESGTTGRDTSVECPVSEGTHVDYLPLSRGCIKICFFLLMIGIDNFVINHPTYTLYLERKLITIT